MRKAYSVERIASRAPSTPIALSCERELVAVLEAPSREGEALADAFRRKEHELGTLFARLHPKEALLLLRRLTTPNPNDVVASRFARLVVERRNRLLVFLADARRRAALAQE